MHTEPLTAASTTPPPFMFEEEPLKHPATFVLAAPPAVRPLSARRVDWAAIGATAFVYGTAFMTWTLLVR